MQHHFLTLAILHSHLEDLLESIGIHVEFNRHEIPAYPHLRSCRDCDSIWRAPDLPFPGIEKIDARTEDLMSIAILRNFGNILIQFDFDYLQSFPISGTSSTLSNTLRVRLSSNDN